MNRRSFLTRLLKSGIAISAAPQIVTHGLNLWVPRRRGISPYLIWPIHFPKSAWMTLIKGGKWPGGMATVINEIAYEPWGPSADDDNVPTWKPIILEV